jgi:ELWxxDGT repeat protein
MRKEVIAGLLVLLMLVAMGGYAMMKNDATSDDSPDDGDDNNEISDEWDVYYVDSGDDLPACGSATLGRLYYVASTAGFETCTSAGWAFVDLTGPAGIAGNNGTDGAQGPSGADGAQGPVGVDGADGADGVNGTDGANGINGTNGQDGANGVDGQDGYGINGTNGTDGQDGSDGLDGQDGYGINGTNGTNGQNGADGHSALAVTSTEPSGANCTDGGIKIEVGVDDNDDGVLQASEIDQTQYVCNGANGSGSPNTMLTRISSPAAQLECDAGGRVVEQGLDNGDGSGTAQNGVLETGEVDYTTTYCSRILYEAEVANDLNEGSGSGQANDIVVMGTRLYFEADDGSSGLELWAHETTNSSTWKVADINSGSGYGQANDIVVMGTRLYFEAYDGSSGYELHMMEIEHTITYD